MGKIIMKTVIGLIAFLIFCEKSYSTTPDAAAGPPQTPSTAVHKISKHTFQDPSESQEETLQPKKLFEEPSFLYDASPLQYEGQPLKFDVITPQLLLSAQTAKVQDEKNLGLYAYRFFFKNNNGVVSTRDIFIEHEPFKEGGI
jgi:hypothetical protein